MNDSRKAYFGKTMLFGEYSVILGSKALVNPLKSFSGQWKNCQPATEYELLLQAELLKFVKHLETQETATTLLHLDALKQQTQDGLWFDADIPHGYGAGSSGAVVAAIYERFAFAPQKDLVLLKRELAQLEGYFHGNSSGLDPLCCLLAQPLLVENDGQIKVLEPFTSQDQFVVYLHDSRLSGKTAPLMTYFHQQMHHQSFYKKVKQQWLPAVDDAIDGFMNKDDTLLFDSLHVISTFQLNHLQPMLPESIVETWKHGLATGDFTMKLCGSGGGGFSLVFANDSRKITTYFPAEHLIRIL